MKDKAVIFKMSQSEYLELKAEVKKKDFDTVSAYLRALIRQDKKKSPMILVDRRSAGVS